MLPGATTAAWRARARAVAEELLIPGAAASDREDRPTEGLRERLASEGFFGLGLPEAFSGRPASTQTIAAVLEELARGSASAATLLAVHLSVCAQPIAQWGSERQRSDYLRPLAEGRSLGAFALTEPEAGSDASSLRTRYRRDGSAFVLDGSKMFITNGEAADLLLTFATRSESEEKSGVSAFLVPRAAEGLRAARHLDKLGLRGSPTNEVVLEGVRLEEDALLGPEGSGLRVAYTALTSGRIGIAACALGVAQAALEELLRFASASSEDWPRSEAARAFARVASARALVLDAARRKDLGERFVEAASAAKLVASEAAVAVAGAAVDLGGREAVRAGATAERLLRDARVFPIVEGTTEIQELILGRRLLDRRTGGAPDEGM